MCRLKNVEMNVIRNLYIVEAVAILVSAMTSYKNNKRITTRNFQQQTSTAAYEPH